jgi:hypothetical protein
MAAFACTDIAQRSLAGHSMRFARVSAELLDHDVS